MIGLNMLIKSQHIMYHVFKILEKKKCNVKTDKRIYGLFCNKHLRKSQENGKLLQKQTQFVRNIITV